MMRFFSLVVALTLAATAAPARQVVVELFTSQACSSCPPAEALLRRLKSADPDILPLSFHVTYWNSPAWTDKFSLTAGTDRQSWYAGLQRSNDVYTPEAIIDGTVSMVGSNRGAVTSAIATAKSSQSAPIKITVTGTTPLIIAVGNGPPGVTKLWLFGYDAAHKTAIGGGENSGVTVNEVNVVRSITSLGAWTGSFVTYTIPRPAGEHMAVLLQADNGQILGAATD